MNDVTFIDFIQMDGSTEEWVDIDWGNDQHTSMSKATYDAQQAQVSTPLASQENN
jgi:hypothetical protein